VSRNLLHERIELCAAAERLVATGLVRPDQESKLAEILEALYRLSGDAESISELRSWLESLSPRPPAVSPWIALTRLAGKAQSSAGDPAGDLGLLDASLPTHPSSINLFLRMEAARLLFRLTEEASVANARVAADPPPAPSLGDRAVEIAGLRLHLAAAAGDWKTHDHLVDALDEGWIAAAGPQAAGLLAIIGQHAVQRGAFAMALQGVRRLQGHPNPEIRLAGLEVCLQALLASGGDLAEGTLRAEIECVAASIELLLEHPTESAEGVERRRRCKALLRLTHSQGSARRGDPEEELHEVAAALENHDLHLIPENRLSLTLDWVRLVLELRGYESAEACEGLVGSVIGETHALGLLVLEMLAWDQRAVIRARYFDSRWDEAVTDAGRAANLAARLLERNREGSLERPLRATLLPIFDRAIELLAEGAWYAILREPAEIERHERFGRALHDYAEQLAELALSEARTHILAGSENAPVIRIMDEGVPARRSEDLQATLRPGEAVLQYLLVSRFLLIFAYGRDFFAWEIHGPEIESPNPPLPIRAYLEENFLGSWRRIQAERWAQSGVLPREVKVSGTPASTRAWASPEDCLRELVRLLIPAKFATVFQAHRVRHLSIVPHDVLYRTPFGSLPWGISHLGSHFTLSIHPTGELAGRSSVKPGQSTRIPMQVKFFEGPGLPHAGDERRALEAAFGGFADLQSVDTSQEGPESFARDAPGCDIIYLACHGSENRLLLGPQEASGISLREAAGVDLRHCRVAILQSCWTGWMNHKREFPVQGFPQALLDAGATAVVAPMFPVHDALCPVFASAFGRALRFLPVCDALGFTLKVLRLRGGLLLFTSPETESFAGVRGAFDAYEYRFTGDSSSRLSGGWLRRGLSRVGFAVWLGCQICYGRWRIFWKAR
jgi:hypothetical protein